MEHSTDAVAGLDGAQSIVVVRGSSTKIERTGKKNKVESLSVRGRTSDHLGSAPIEA